MALDIKFRPSARLLLVWFSFVTIQASASIPYWPQNDGSSLELGEFTITKRLSNKLRWNNFNLFSLPSWFQVQLRDWLLHNDNTTTHPRQASTPKLHLIANRNCRLVFYSTNETYTDLTSIASVVVVARIGVNNHQWQGRGYIRRRYWHDFREWRLR